MTIIMSKLSTSCYPQRTIPNQKQNSPDVWVGGVVLVGPGSRAIDGLSVDPKPLSHLTESLLVDRSDLSIGCWPNIHQQIASQTRWRGTK